MRGYGGSKSSERRGRKKGETSDMVKGMEKKRAKRRPYTAFLKNIEGDGALYNMAVPHPLSPVLHIHRDLVLAPIRILQLRSKVKMWSRCNKF